MRRKAPTVFVGIILGAAGMLAAACGTPAPSPARDLIAKIPGCGQVKTWGGDPLISTTSNGYCYLNDGETQVRILTWPEGDTTDQASYANSGSFIAPGPCTITGSNPVPWAAEVNIADTAPAYAASVQQLITSSLGGTSPGGAACTGSVVIPDPSAPPRSC